jgi:hypothetical protein
VERLAGEKAAAEAALEARSTECHLATSQLGEWRQLVADHTEEVRSHRANAQALGRHIVALGGELESAAAKREAEARAAEDRQVADRAAGKRQLAETERQLAETERQLEELEVENSALRAGRLGGHTRLGRGVETLQLRPEDRSNHKDPPTDRNNKNNNNNNNGSAGYGPQSPAATKRTPSWCQTTSSPPSKLHNRAGGSGEFTPLDQIRARMGPLGSVGSVALKPKLLKPYIP